MLVCALLVWTIFPFININETSSSLTYLTEIECKKTIKSNNDYCILIDKRKDFTLQEWQEDNCVRSEHKWIGNQ